MSERFAAVGLLAAGIAIGWGVWAAPPSPEPFARYVDHGFKSGDIQDLAPVLHVERYGGQVQLNSGFHSVKLALAAYKDGKPVELPDAEADLLSEAEMNCTLKYAVHVIDLDFLQLGSAKKNHCRMRFTLRGPDGATTWAERDVPKDVIDLSHCSNVGFTERAATNTEVPLFWLKTGGTIPGPNVATKQEVIEKWTKDGSVLIVSLRFNNSKKGK